MRGGNEYANRAYGCRFSLGESWKLAEEKERQGVLTLRVQAADRESSYLVVTVFQADRFTPAETLNEAGKLLQKGLYEPREPIGYEEIILASGRSLPFLRVQAGRREQIEAGTAVLYGSRFTALVTLIARQEHFESGRFRLAAFLEKFELE